MRKNIIPLIVGCGIALLASACTVTSDDGPPPRPVPTITSVTVDTGATLTAPPGIGAGVNVEYQTGGHWHIWWTCDTQVSGLGCQFYVDAIVQSGTITNVKGDQLESDDSLSQPSPTEVSLTTNTSTGVDGVFFDTSPGATINLLQRIGDTQDGSFFYWGQMDKSRAATIRRDVADPCDFTGSSP